MERFKYGQTIHFGGHTVDVMAKNAQWPEVVRRCLELLPAEKVAEISMQVYQDFQRTRRTGLEIE